MCLKSVHVYSLCDKVLKMCWWFSWSFGLHNWLSVGFGWWWWYRCLWSLPCHWLCTGVVVSIVIRFLCVDVVLPGVSYADFSRSTRLRRYLLALVSTSYDFSSYLLTTVAHSQALCPLCPSVNGLTVSPSSREGGGVGLWHVGCTILPAFSADPLTAGWVWCGQQFVVWAGLL